ncbi:tyrosine-type recombinase/integrase [Microbacterium maritypicum]|uniref:site-specific integrase n=1 Tax=Microbacterium maritypicum TaxID=33918 RepID=UPI0026712F2E|nr:tyrosine-type recombinase/integrase [Microbacterium liquefaciens]WKT89561.1 tyrosine-type recombinase/integrase [Microbacterium liquefaciens]
MARPRTPLSSFGRISVDPVEYVAGEPKADGAAGRRRLVVVRGIVDPQERRRHDYWRARTRYRFPNGSIRQVERFATSPAKAEAALKHALTTLQAGTAAEVKRETRIKDLGERFLLSKADRAPRTVETYTHSVRRVIVPRIGELAVSEATADRLQRALDAIAAENGPGEAKKARAVLSGMMGLAARSDAVAINPVRALAPIEAKAVGAVAVPLAELPGLLERVRNDEAAKATGLADLVAFIAGTGVRITETIDLNVGDVNGNVVAIRKSKTTAGERRITVPAAVAAMLEERTRSDLTGLPLFPTPLGKRRDRRNTSGEWQATRERLGLPDYTFHSFRKTVATALDQAGLSARDIAEYLGHANPSLTMNTYMSKTVGGSRAADALDSLMRVRQD